jgi:dimethylargininase
MFTKAIVKRPCKNFVHGLTSAELGLPDYEKALKQHDNYIKALIDCGLEVLVLEADESYPDSVFVEDVALLTTSCAVITNPGTASRKGEIKKMEGVLSKYYSHIAYIKNPGTLEAGDVMMVEDHFYIGLSQRTNQEGASQLIDILVNYGYTGSTVELKEMLHLKTGLSYLENKNLLVSGEFVSHPEFQKFNRLLIDASENYAANSLWVNNKVLVPEGYPKTKKIIEKAGYEVLSLDVSEFRKLDGGLSCLSLRC